MISATLDATLSQEKSSELGELEEAINDWQVKKNKTKKRMIYPKFIIDREHNIIILHFQYKNSNKMPSYSILLASEYNQLFQAQPSCLRTIQLTCLF